LGDSCGYYVLLEGSREDQSARGLLKVILIKLPRAKKERRKRKDTEDSKRDLGKYSREKTAREKREREMGLVVDQDQGRGTLRSLSSLSLSIEIGMK